MAGQLPPHGSTFSAASSAPPAKPRNDLKQSWHVAQGLGDSLGAEGTALEGAGPVTAPLRRQKRSRDDGSWGQHGCGSHGHSSSPQERWDEGFAGFKGRGAAPTASIQQL